MHRIYSSFAASIKIVADIYNAYPIVAFFQVKNEQTPISITIDTGFKNAVYFLAKVCPEACAITNYDDGSTPLLLAVHKISYSNMIDILLGANPRAAFIKRYDGGFAFNAFFDEWNVFIRISLHNEIIKDQVHEYVVGVGYWEIFDIYQKGCLFLDAANLHRVGQKLGNEYLLHFALRKESCTWFRRTSNHVTCSDAFVDCFPLMNLSSSAIVEFNTSAAICGSFIVTESVTIPVLASKEEDITLFSAFKA